MASKAQQELLSEMGRILDLNLEFYEDACLLIIEEYPVIIQSMENAWVFHGVVAGFDMERLEITSQMDVYQKKAIQLLERNAVLAKNGGPSICLEDNLIQLAQYVPTLYMDCPSMLDCIVEFTVEMGKTNAILND